MFVVAIFDWREASPGGLPAMVLARGPLGVKPLYVAAAEGDSRTVVFASEVRALLASGLVDRRVDLEGLSDYLSCGFVVQPRTIFSGVRMLASGWLERVHAGPTGRAAAILRMPPYEPRDESLDQAAERLRAVLDESVALHAFADAPVGAFLSGGVDSSGCVGLMRRHVSDLRTYTLKYADAPLADESEYAVATAKALDCRNTLVEISGREMPRLLPIYAEAMDQPSNDGLNTWIISRAAARDVKAVLSGVGGDEWFSGYPVTRRMAYGALHPLGRVKAFAGRIAAHLNGWLPEGQVRQRAYNLAMRRSPLAMWIHSHGVFRYDQARHMLGLRCDRFGQIKQYEYYLSELRPEFQRESPIGLSCLLDFWVYMGSQLLRDSDVMSMKHSLELRNAAGRCRGGEVLPHLPRRFQAPRRWRLGGPLFAKRREAGVDPRTCATCCRPTSTTRPKRGFTLPVVHWLQTDLRELLLETCAPKRWPAGG